VTQPEAEEMVVPLGRDRRPKLLRPFRVRPASTLNDVHRTNLELVGDAFSRTWTASLAAQTRSEVSVALTSVSPWSWADMLNSLPEPGCGSPVAAPPLGGAGVITCSLSLAMAIVDRMLGGPGSADLAARPLTEVETKLIQEIEQRCMEDLASSLAIVVPIKTEVAQQESRLQLIKASRLESPLIMLSFMVSVGKAEGEILIGLPADGLVSKLDDFSGIVVAPPTMSSISGPLLEAHIELRLCLNPVSLTPDEILQLAVGDVLTLPHKLHEPMTVMAGDQPLLSAVAGRRGSRLACAIVEPSVGGDE
jgi:flagellar motor switch protein FliM